MNAKARIEKLEAQAAPAWSTPLQYTREQFQAMTHSELLRAHSELISAPLPKLTREEAQRQREYSARKPTPPKKHTTKRSGKIRIHTIA